jgi:O-phospho-L-seryl-tRNASec:L-selenocysteinyl-tRNA synthase
MHASRSFSNIHPFFSLASALGGTRTQKCIVLPLATGMSIVMVLLSLRSRKPDAKYVIWTRIDQKTCLKAIVTAGTVFGID